MKFLHEAYKCDSINLDNEYAGTWSFVVWFKDYVLIRLFKHSY
jgi:hypothetical protein